jgi:hypothetical protein
VLKRVVEAVWQRLECLLARAPVINHCSSKLTYPLGPPMVPNLLLAKGWLIGSCYVFDSRGNSEPGRKIAGGLRSAPPHLLLLFAHLDVDSVPVQYA